VQQQQTQPEHQTVTDTQPLALVSHSASPQLAQVSPKQPLAAQLSVCSQKTEANSDQH
jgi:hypothetical protein